jgi:hypothetical protein
LNYSVTFGIDGHKFSSWVKLISCSALLALLTISSGLALAQMATPSAPGLNMNAAAPLVVPGDYGTSGAPVSTMLTPPPAQQGLNVTMLGEPAYGSAPLAVDFLVTIANPQSSAVYQWNFGDGAVSSLPASTVIPHVYEHAGTYLCALVVTASQGRSATVFTTIVVRPGGG